jgi:hypothetical protein
VKFREVPCVWFLRVGDVEEATPLMTRQDPGTACEPDLRLLIDGDGEYPAGEEAGRLKKASPRRDR